MRNVKQEVRRIANGILGVKWLSENSYDKFLEL